VCAALLGFARDARELTPLPIENRGFVPFARPPFGLLGAPTEPLAQEAADVVVVKANAEVTVDDVANASGGPERSGPAVRLRALQGQRFELAELRIGQLSRPMGIGERRKGVCSALAFCRQR
jgi:hypothetical protein